MLAKLPPFDYCQPASLKEALALMGRFDCNVGLLAGGTDLLVAMKEQEPSHRLLLDIKRVPELTAVTTDNGRLCFGAAVTTRSIARSRLVRERIPLLSQALQVLGSMQIGNRATIGGNLCNASPAADSAPPLLALDASVKLVGEKGERRLPLESFFLAPGKTVLEREILTEIQVPAAPAQGRGVFYKLGPRGAPEDICIASVGLFAVPDASRMIWKEARIALGAVAPTPIRARHAEEALRGQLIGGKAGADAARLAAEKDARPISDIRGSARYRSAMVRLLVERALEQVGREISGETTL